MIAQPRSIDEGLHSLKRRYSFRENGGCPKVDGPSRSNETGIKVLGLPKEKRARGAATLPPVLQERGIVGTKLVKGNVTDTGNGGGVENPGGDPPSKNLSGRTPGLGQGPQAAPAPRESAAPPFLGRPEADHLGTIGDVSPQVGSGFHQLDSHALKINTHDVFQGKATGNRFVLGFVGRQEECVLNEFLNERPKGAQKSRNIFEIGPLQLMAKSTIEMRRPMDVYPRTKVSMASIRYSFNMDVAKEQPAMMP